MTVIDFVFSALDPHSPQNRRIVKDTFVNGILGLTGSATTPRGGRARSKASEAIQVIAKDLLNLRALMMEMMQEEQLGFLVLLATTLGTAGVQRLIAGDRSRPE